MIISKKVTYAVQAIALLQKEAGKTLSVKYVAKKLLISHDSCAQVLNILKRHQVLISQKGKDGGYILSVYDVSLGDLVEWFAQTKSDDIVQKHLIGLVEYALQDITISKFTVIPSVIKSIGDKYECRTTVC